MTECVWKLADFGILILYWGCTSCTVRRTALWIFRGRWAKPGSWRWKSLAESRGGAFVGLLGRQSPRKRGSGRQNPQKLNSFCYLKAILTSLLCIHVLIRWYVFTMASFSKNVDDEESRNLGCHATQGRTLCTPDLHGWMVSACKKHTRIVCCI